jgi:hypothetical protein
MEKFKDKAILALLVLLAFGAFYGYYDYLMKNPDALPVAQGVRKIELDGHTYYKSIDNGNLTHSEACQCKTR